MPRSQDLVLSFREEVNVRRLLASVEYDREIELSMSVSP